MFRSYYEALPSVPAIYRRHCSQLPSAAVDVAAVGGESLSR